MTHTMRFATNLAKGILGKPDPEGVWHSIISYIPDEILAKPNVKILNVAFGHLTEARILVQRMRALGKTADEIKDSIYLIDKYRVFCADAKEYGYKHIIHADFLSHKFNMKFDIIIGNPPYNKGINLLSNAENAAGYPHLAFMNAAQKLIKEDGLISFIMPVSFMTLPSCHDWRNDILSKGTFKYITLIDNRKNEAFDIKFPWVCNVIFQPGKSESNITYDIISNKPSDTISLNLNDYTYLDNDVKKTTWPLFTTYYIKTIFDKVRAQSKKLDRPMPRELKTGLSKPYISYMVQGYDTRPVVNDIPKAKATGENIRGEAYLYFDTDADAYKYCDFMNSKLFSMLLECTTGTGKTQPMSIQQIGNFDFSNVNTNDDQELYKFFNLDADEIAYIESY